MIMLLAFSQAPEDPDVGWLVIIAFLLVGWAFVFVHWAARATRGSNDPRTVLRRCRASLWGIRKELESLPAGREVHQLHAECDRTEDTINRVEAEL